jgi:dTDP-4-dehydrorhamnose reductase
MILVTGATGQLGRSIVDAAGRLGTALSTPSRREFDVRDTENRYVVRTRPSAVVHCAAEADLRRCHDDPAYAMDVNAAAALNVAQQCGEIGALMVYVSTDAVFPGHPRYSGYTEEDVPDSPPTVYGVAKLAGEHLVVQAARTLIVRVGWLFGPTVDRDKKFIGIVLRHANAGTLSRVVIDKVGSPSFAPHVGQLILEYAVKEIEGIRHVANAGVVSRYEFACAALTECGFGAVAPTPVTSDAFPDPVARPTYGGLATLYADALLPDWRAAVAEFGKVHRGATCLP